MHNLIRSYCIIYVYIYMFVSSLKCDFIREFIPLSLLSLPWPASCAWPWASASSTMSLRRWRLATASKIFQVFTLWILFIFWFYMILYFYMMLLLLCFQRHKLLHPTGPPSRFRIKSFQLTYFAMARRIRHICRISVLSGPLGGCP